MKLKYYMRGLGIGVIVTAILFTLAFPKNKAEMTEAEIIAKAPKIIQGRIGIAGKANQGHDKKCQNHVQ